MKQREHWENVYKTKAPNALSWYAPHLQTSFSLIERVCPMRKCSVIDVGGGEATLVDDLVGNGYCDVTVLDISAKALKVAKSRISGASRKFVTWIAGDVTRAHLEEGRYDVWHDRAVFHFLTSAKDRARYIAQVRKAVKPGGYVIVATFGPQGPEMCSGLPVARYDAKGLHHQFGRKFRLMQSTTEMHATPFGTMQQFVYCLCRIDTA
jgi:SAM-dependent methyltransferase